LLALPTTSKHKYYMGIYIPFRRAQIKVAEIVY